MRTMIPVTALALLAACDGARFVLPACDVVFLPCANITVEALAHELACRIVLHDELAPHIGAEIREFSVAVAETPGQEARITYDAANLKAELLALRGR